MKKEVVMNGLKEKHKILVMVILLAFATFLTYYFHAVLKTGIVFTHFFYIPIILAALWWKRKGLAVVIFIAALLIFSDIIFNMPSFEDIPRIIMFMVIGFIVSVMSETIVKSDELVSERTSELHESEAKYRTLYESSSDAIMLLDEKGFFDCNNATLAVFGFLKKEDFIKTHPSDVSPPYQSDGTDSLTAANNKISQAFMKGINSFEWIHRRKNGIDFPAEVLLTAFQLNGNQVLQATVRDITERKRAEEELIKYRDHLEDLVKERTAELNKDIDVRRQVEEKLREASAYTRSLIEVSLDPLVTINPEGKITDVNKATESVTGISREKLIGSDFSIYFTEPEKAREGYQQVFDHGFVKDYPLAIRHFSGSITDVLYNATVYKDGMGNVAGVFAAARDITERKRAEEELRRNEKSLQEAQRLAHIGSWQWIVATDTVKWSEELYHIDGLDQNFPAPSYAQMSSYYTSESWKRLNAAVMKALESGESYELDLDMVRPDGATIHTSARGEADYDAGGKIVGLHGTVQDITETKLAEEELKKYREHLEELVNERTREVRLAKEDAEHANMAKTNFLQTMSHELKTPLNAILGFSEILKQKIPGKLNEKQEHFIDNIVTSGNNLNNIINQILEIVKMEEGTLELHIETIPVHETLDEAIGVIKEFAEKNNVLIEKNLDPELEYIEVDKQKFKRVFINLLENAVKFSKQEGGTVTIDAKKEGDMARFSVSDRGIGIKEEDIEKIFQKFIQLDSGTSRKYGGTGIGLAISKQFIKMHGGSIWVKSIYGEGSTFTILIPLRKKEARII